VARGIGAAVARALAAEGAAIVIAARSADRIEKVADEIRRGGGKAWAVPCDVTDATSVHALAQAAARRAGVVDILVNNAGTRTAHRSARSRSKIGIGCSR